MSCPICDQKPANCDCTAKEREQYSEIEDLHKEMEELRSRVRFCDRVIQSSDAATLTLDEREVIEYCLAHAEGMGSVEDAAALRRLLKRTK